MNLFEINKRLAACVRLDDSAIDTETGEIIDVEALDALEMERDEKIENIGLWIKQEGAMAEALKAEKQALEMRQKAHANRAERLKQYIADVLKGKKWESAKVRISFRTTPAVEVDDMAALPDSFMRVPAPQPDKVAIKAAIKDGAIVPGARLVDRQSILIK